MRVSDPDDEFSFLPAQAAELGVPAVPQVQRLQLTLDDGRTLSALRYGAPAEPEVTLLHGAGLNAHTWDATVLALGLPALALDLPGHGDSAWRDDADYSPRSLTPDVIRAMREWTDRPQVLVGQSLGGVTAAAVAAAAPELVRALVIVDITPGVEPAAGPSQLREFFAGPTDWASRDELVDRALAFGFGGGSREATARGVALNSRIRPDGRVEWKHHYAHLAAARAADPDAAAAARAGRATADIGRDVLMAASWGDFEAASVPLTLVRGARGYVTEADAAEFARRLPDATVVTLPAGHNVQEELPRELGLLVADAASRRDPARTEGPPDTRPGPRGA